MGGLIYLTFISKLLMFCFAIDCDDISRYPIKQARSSLHNNTVPERFIDQERKFSIYNDHFPDLCKDALRIMTFNIHYHMDIFDRQSNLKSLKRDLSATLPSVAMLEEVALKTSQDRVELDSLGLEHRLMAAADGSSIGNMIASRYPIDMIAVKNLGEKRVFIAASIFYNDINVVLLSLHLDHKSSTTRKRQILEVVKFIKKKIVSEYDHFLLAGDFNSEWQTGVIDIVRDSDLFLESFRTLNWPPPEYTFWSGKTIDFIFTGQALAGLVAGSYIYHTDSSDHLPIYVDIVMN